MAKVNQIQVRWFAQEVEGVSHLVPRITEPYDMMKNLIFIGAPEALEGDEWLCAAVKDTRPDRDKIGDMTVRFIRIVRDEWVYEPSSPLLYGCQTVSAVLMRGIRTRHRIMTPEVKQRVSEAQTVYEAALAKARVELMAQVDGKPGPGIREIRISNDGLSGTLHSGCTQFHNRRIRLGDGLNPIPRHDHLKQEGAALYRTWVFMDKYGTCEIGKSAVATRLGPYLSIIDVRHTLSELGLPDEIDVRSSGPDLIFDLTWRGQAPKPTAKDENSVHLTLCSLDELKAMASDFNEIMRHRGHEAFDPGIISEDPLHVALDHPEFGPRLKQAIEEYERLQAESRKAAEESRIRDLEDERRSNEERRLQLTRDKAKREQPTHTGPATIESLKNKFGRRG